MTVLILTMEMTPEREAEYQASCAYERAVSEDWDAQRTAIPILLREELSVIRESKYSVFKTKIEAIPIDDMVVYWHRGYCRIHCWHLYSSIDQMVNITKNGNLYEGVLV
jgi:hypothetical protein